MAEMLQRSLGPAIEINMEFPPGLVMLRVDPNQLELALLNLALNGRDAMPQGGRLTIAARRETIEMGRQDLRPGDYVCIAVTDTGIGMDEATLKRAAEPFFTTKGVGKGTGLGLSMVHGLAAQSEGAARITSRVGIGTTVELWLPVADDDESARRQAAASVIGPTRLCSILIVDDDPMVAATTAAMLEDLGHSVLVVSSGPLALNVVRSDAHIDLIVTDYAMPGMTGAELAKDIRQARPDLPIILATGYADLPNADDPGLPRLAKPYRREEMARLLATLVGSEPAAKIVKITGGMRG